MTTVLDGPGIGGGGEQPPLTICAFLPAPEPTVLCVHARDRDTKIRFVTNAAPVAGSERVVDRAFFDSIEDAEALEQACRSYLEDAKAPADAQGWHRFPAGKVANLLQAARNRVWAAGPAEEVVEAAVLAPSSPLEPPGPLARLSRWTLERAAWFGFLVGLGWSAKRIAADELIRTTPANVYKRAERFGLSISEVPQGQVCLDLPHATLAALDRAAALAHLQRDRFIERLLIRAANDPARFGLVVVSG